MTPAPKKKTGLDKIAAAILAPPEQPDEIGRLGSYRVLSVLGKGGMGMVFRAEDPALRRLVALKIMLPELARRGSAKDRFLREARLAATLEHDHVVTIHQVGEDRGIPFIAMSFLKGMSLDDWLKQKRPLAMPQILRIGRETAKGLAAAHERGLIHRDIKPANLWLDGSSRGRVKILDFGLARAEKEDVALTRSGQIVGTPQYMSPEQAAGEKLDARSDLFSLGVVLYRMCTGTQPFRGDNVMAVLTALAVHEPPSAISLNPETPPAFSELIDRLLRKKPAERVGTAKEVVDTIAKIERNRALQKLGAAPTEMSVTPAISPDAARIAASQAFNFEDSTDSLLSDEDLTPIRKTKELATASRPAWLWPALFGGIAALVLGVTAVSIAMLSGKSNGVDVARDTDRHGPIVEKKTTPQPIEPKPVEPRPIEPVPTVTAAPDAKVAAPGGAQGIKLNLLPLIDVDRDKVSGIWKVSAEGLECESGTLARIKIPYHPVGQYDFRIVFTRRSGGFAVTQILSQKKKGFLWAMSAGGIWSGLELLDGKDVLSSPKHAKSHLDNGRRHESIVQVRNNLVRTYVDGTLECEHWTSFVELQMPGTWSLGNETLLGLGSSSNAICFHEIEVVERSGPGEFLRSDDPAAKNAAALRDPRSPTATSPTGFRFDALPLIDIKKDEAQGPWSFDKLGQLWAGEADFARIGIPYIAPVEYDVDTSFTRESGNDVVAQILVGAGRQFQFSLGAFGNTAALFDRVDKMGDWGSKTQVRKITKNRKPYRMLVTVRKDRVTAYLDGERVTSLDTDYSNVEINRSFSLKDPRTLGLGVCRSSTVFHRVEITEVSGPGKFLRPKSPQAEAIEKARADFNRKAVADAQKPGVGTRLDLLSLVKFDEDKVNGGWKQPAWGEVQSDDSKFAVLRVPYRPPEEYDLIAEFTRVSGSQGITLTLIGGGRQFRFGIGDERNTISGFGKYTDAEIAKYGKKEWLTSGRRYKALVQVRKNGVKAFVDGVLAADPVSDFRSLNMGMQSAKHDRTALEVGSHMSETIFHRVEVVEISGPGSFVRPEDPAAERLVNQRRSEAPPAAVAPFDGLKAAEFQKLWAVHLGRKVEEKNSIGMRLRLIPPGEFTMGDPGFGDSKPHRVRLTRPFFLGACEVSRGEYAKVVPTAEATNPQFPRGSVSWNDATQFCLRLSERPEERAAGRRYRLPTEAEWEYACRAGTTTRYHFGDAVDLARANFKGTTPPKATPVGSYPPNAWALHDMHGNVREWVADWYDPSYPETGPRDDPKGPRDGNDRIVRGGGMSESSFPAGERVMRQTPDTKYSDLGFRVVCDIDPPADRPVGLKMSNLLPFDHSVFHVAFSPDGKSLAVCGDGREVRIWDLTTNPPKLRCTIAGNSYRAAACEFDRTGSILYVGAQDGVIRAWNAATGELVEQFVGHTAAITGVAISDNGDRMVSSSNDKTVRLWDLKNPREPSVVLPSKKIQNSPQPTSHDSTVSGCAVGADLAFSSTGDGLGSYWDLKKKTQLWTKRLHNARIESIVFAPDRQSFATASHNGHVRVWTRGGDLLQDIDIPGTKALGLAYSPESKLVAVGGSDAKVRVFDVASGHLIAVAVCPAKEAFAVAWSPDGKTIASGEVYGARAVRLWDVSALRSSWQPLFDGKSLAGWSPHAENPDAISVTSIDGESAIRISGPKKKSAYLISNRVARDFELRCEFRVDPDDPRSSGYLGFGAFGGNVGLPIRFLASGGSKLYSDRWRLSLESAEPKNGKIVPTGLAPQRVDLPMALLRPAGQWNRLESARLDDSILFRLNGRHLAAFARLRAVPKDKDIDLGRTNISLYRQEGTVFYRRVEIREIHALPEEYASAP